VNLINIKATENSPSVLLYATKGLIKIEGESYLDNTFDFYQVILSWLYDYFQAPTETTTVDLNLSCFNSSTVQILFEIFDIFEENSQRSQLIINWYYDINDIYWKDDYECFVEEFKLLTINAIGEKRV